jgi:hypothetical protein
VPASFRNANWSYYGATTFVYVVRTPSVEPVVSMLKICWPLVTKTLEFPPTVTVPVPLELIVKVPLNGVSGESHKFGVAAGGVK